MAKSIVHDTGDLIKLVGKYRPISKNTSYAGLLSEVQDLLATSNEFANDYSAFLLKKGRIIDYNHALDPITAIADLGTAIIGKIGTKKERQLEQQKLASQNTAQIMNFMMQEEQTRQAEKNREANMIYIAIGAMVLITGIIIFTRKN